MAKKKIKINLAPSSGSSSLLQKKKTAKEESKVPFIDRGKAIPSFYGETKLIILPRDPSWVYAYWDVSQNTRNKIESQYGKETIRKARAVIRVFDVSGIIFDGKNAHNWFDIDVNLDSRNWYIKIDNAHRRNFCADLGFVTKSGKFINIARSNTIAMPSGRISDITDEEWMIIHEDFEKLMKLSGEGKIGKSSAENIQMMLQRIEKVISASNIGGSGLVSSFGLPVEGEEGKKRGFWLVADAELIVYGATEKDASLKVKGNSIKLKEDGSFHLRFALPDGTNEIPVEAESSDGVEKRKITITVTRSTK